MQLTSSLWGDTLRPCKYPTPNQKPLMILVWSIFNMMSIFQLKYFFCLHQLYSTVNKIPPFSSIYVGMYVFTSIYYLSIIVIGSWLSVFSMFHISWLYLIIWILNLSHIWPMSLSSWFLFLWHTPIIILSTFLISGITICSRVILFLPCLALKSAVSPRSSVQ